LCASDFAPTLVNDCLRYVDWSTPRQHPPDISHEHISILKSTGAFFARKFKNLTVVEEVDRIIRLTSGPDMSMKSSVAVEHIRERIRKGLLPENRGCDKVWVDESLESHFRQSIPFAEHNFSLVGSWQAPEL